MSKITNEKNYVQKGDSLREQSWEVPEFPGVYYILRLANGKIDLVYIGKSGGVLQNGTFNSQWFKDHSNNEQEGLSNVILIYTDVCRLGIKSSRLGQRIYHSTEILA